MIEVTAILMGLWSWLFCEYLTQPNHVFHYLKFEGKPTNRTEALWMQYTSCAMCHAGAAATAYSLLYVAAYANVFTTGMAIPAALISLSGTLLTTLFTSATIAMTVAKVMSIKF